MRLFADLTLLSLLQACATFDPAAHGSRPGDRELDSLVAAERAFAALARATDTRTAFLAFLDDSSVMFRPHPVDGRRSTAAQPVRPLLLLWEPGFADIAASRECGYTTGPWKVAQRTAPDSVIASGHFVTFWRKEKGWKVLLDVGISHAAPAAPPPDLVIGPLSRRPSRRGSADVRQGGGGATIKEEERLHQDLGMLPAAEAYRSVMAEDIRLYRDDLPPFLGREHAALAISAVEGRTSSSPIRTWRSAAGDLACSYGSYLRHAEGRLVEKGYYVRIWRSEGDAMRLALDLWSSVPLSEEAP
jgi:hypothetical protein